MKSLNLSACLKLCIVLTPYGSRSYSQTNKEQQDTVRVQLLISTIDTINNPYAQHPVFVKNGYLVIKKPTNKDESPSLVGFLDWFKKPLPKDEKIWQYWPYAF